MLVQPLCKGLAKFIQINPVFISNLRLDLSHSGSPDNGNRYCRLLTRDPATAVVNGFAFKYDNGPIQRFRGWTSEVAYRMDLNRLDRLSGSRASLTATEENRQYLYRDSWTAWDANVSYRATDSLRVNFAVINLGDKIGPFPYVLDSLGRRYMLTVKYSFR